MKSSQQANWRALHPPWVFLKAESLQAPLNHLEPFGSENSGPGDGGTLGGQKRSKRRSKKKGSRNKSRGREGGRSVVAGMGSSLMIKSSQYVACSGLILTLHLLCG